MISAVTARAWQVRNGSILAPAGRGGGSLRELAVLRSRDRAQAENLFGLWSKYRHAKMIVIGQSSHCARMLQPARWLGMPEGRYRSALSFLQAKVGNDAVRSFSITGYKIAGSTGPVAPPRSKASLERMLHLTGMKFGFVDASGDFARSRKAWTIADQGSQMSRGELLTGLSSQFDGYFFIDLSGPATPLPTPYDLWRW
jgi:erythromycin esterase-like protein